MAGSLPSVRMRSWIIAGAGALLLVFVLQVHGSVRHKSAILHEPLYTYAGYRYLTRGDYGFNHDSPPLLKQMAALPLLPLGLDVADTSGERRSVLVTRFLYENRVAAAALLARARAPFLVLGILLGLVLFRWASLLYGAPAGLLALWLYAFNPALLGQGGFANHDFGLACLSVASLYAGWRLTESPTLSRALASGVVLGLTLLTKFSALLLVPTLVVLGLADVLVRGTKAKPLRALSRRAVLLAVVLTVAAFVVWADYGFGVGTIRVDQYRKAFETIAPGGTVSRLVAYLPPTVVLPASVYVEGAVAQMIHGWIGHINYLLGEVSSKGWWYYYLLTFLYRVPIPLFVLAALRLATWRAGTRERAWAEVWLLSYALLTTVLFSMSRTQLGQRYVLVVYPLAFVFMAGLADTSSGRRGRVLRPIAAVCLLWYAAISLRTYPDYLTYFNPVGGGPDAGYRKIVEGVDLGQDAEGLRRFVADESISEIGVSCFGCPPPRYLGPEFKPLGCQPTAGWVAVSVRQLVMPQPFRRPGCFAWLADREPVARIGHSIHVFRMSEGGS